MNIDHIPIGDDPPNSVNVIIEVPVGGEPVKSAAGGTPTRPSVS